MKVPRGSRPSATIPLVSTADVAFLLLIFFIVLAKNANESAVSWRPASTTAVLIDAKSVLCSVIIDEHNTIHVNGHECGIGAVKDSVASYLGNAPAGDRKVLIKIDKEVPERIFTQVMLDIGAAGGELFRALESESDKKK